MSSSAPPVRGAPPPARPADLELEAPAKINLFLEVLGRRADGYHDIETIMMAVDLCDRLSFWRRQDPEVTISVSGGDAPADASNLAMRAAEAVRGAGGVREGLHLHIEKRIPSGGGLGGGSSDAGTVIRGLDRLWALGMAPADMERIGAALGSDVNFFLHGGLAVCRGRGEIVEPIGPPPAGLGVLLYLPPLHVATPGVYSRLRLSLTASRRSCTNLARQLSSGDLGAVGQELFNRLEEPVFESHPQLEAAKRQLRGSRALGSLLSGSGSTIYALSAAGDLDGLVREVPMVLRRDALRPVRPVKGWARESAV